MADRTKIEWADARWRDGRPEDAAMDADEIARLRALADDPRAVEAGFAKALLDLRAVVDLLLDYSRARREAPRRKAG